MDERFWGIWSCILEVTRHSIAIMDSEKPLRTVYTPGRAAKRMRELTAFPFNLVTVRRWMDAGKFGEVMRTPGRQRLVSEEQILAMLRKYGYVRDGRGEEGTDI